MPVHTTGGFINTKLNTGIHVLKQGRAYSKALECLWMDLELLILFCLKVDIKGQGLWHSPSPQAANPSSTLRITRIPKHCWGKPQTSGAGVASKHCLHVWPKSSHSHSPLQKCLHWGPPLCVGRISMWLRKETFIFRFLEQLTQLRREMSSPLPCCFIGRAIAYCLLIACEIRNFKDFFVVLLGASEM